jgi:protein-tyrosine phosphatase
MAEHVFAHHLDKISGWHGEVYSAGVNALVNSKVDTTTLALMLNRGTNIELHRARQLTAEHLRESELVLVMENQHRLEVLEIDSNARGKTFLLGHWNNTEIQDPYQCCEVAYVKALLTIESCVKLWIEKIIYR